MPEQAKSQTPKVMAKNSGFYGGAIRAEGKPFDLKSVDEFEPSWMVPLNFTPKVKAAAETKKPAEPAAVTKAELAEKDKQIADLQASHADLTAKFEALSSKLEAATTPAEPAKAEAETTKQAKTPVKAEADKAE